MTFTRKLIIDCETYSEVDLKKQGLDVYARHPSTRCLMVGWRVDEVTDTGTIKGIKRMWEPDLETMPVDLHANLVDPTYLKIAWNVSFEYNIFLHVLGIKVPFNQWRDAAVWARALSMPGSLESTGEIMGLRGDQAKSKAGKALIKLFSMPYKPKKLTKKQLAAGMIQQTGLVRNDRVSHPAEWGYFRDYCLQDVDAEATLDEMMESLPLPQEEQEGWELDQKMNEEGLPVNLEFVDAMIAMATAAQDEGNKLLKLKTGLANPNSPMQMLNWARERGYPFTSLNKAFVKRALEDEKWGGVSIKVMEQDDEEVDEFDSVLEEVAEAAQEAKNYTPEQAKEAKEVLALRLAYAKNSWKKLDKIKLQTADGITRNQFLYLGAGRTGRWSGRGFQPQNLGRPDKSLKKRMDEAMALILARDYDKLKSSFDCGVMTVIISCLRACIQAPEGNKFVVGDLSSIEYNVLAWLANCGKMLDIARDPDGDCYLAFTSFRTGIPYKELLERYRNEDPEVMQWRQDDKPPVLGGGYGLGPGKRVKRKGNLVATGLLGYAENMGIPLTQEQCVAATKIYRDEYIEVVALWHNLENAAIEVLRHGKPVQVGPVVFSRKKCRNGESIMQIKLPSGRSLTYLNACVRSVPSQMREWTDAETGEEVQAFKIECTELCGAKYTFKKPTEPGPDVDPDSVKWDIYRGELSDWESLEANHTIIKGCPKCDWNHETVWKRSLEERLMYDGLGHGVGAIQSMWGPVYTYGGKITENIVQAIARDILLHAMKIAAERGFSIRGCFHDEILAMVRALKFGLGLQDLLNCLTSVPWWAPGLPLAAAGYEGPYYKK